jgi:hypothetical protein
MLAWVGRQLGAAWGDRRLGTRLAAIVAGAGALTMLLLAPLEPFAGASLRSSFSGLWPVANALLLAWGLTFPNLEVSWFGVLQMRGATVARVVAWGTALWAALHGFRTEQFWEGPAAYLPHLAALFVAWLLLAGGPRRLLTRLRIRIDERRLKKRLKRFEVIDTRPPPGGWVN